MQRVKELIDDVTGPVKWVFYGDSITHGAQHTHGWRDYTQLFAERVRYELARRQDIVINTAISGNGCRQLIDEYTWRCGQFKPHVVFVMIGMNDCCNADAASLAMFGDRLRILAKIVETDGGVPVLQTTCPIIPAGSPKREALFDAFMEAVREVAASMRLPLIDHHAYWRQYAARHWFWQADACHPNEYGHRAFAFKMFQDLGIFDEKSDTCRLLLP